METFCVGYEKFYVADTEQAPSMSIMPQALTRVALLLQMQRIALSCNSTSSQKKWPRPRLRTTSRAAYGPFSYQRAAVSWSKMPFSNSSSISVPASAWEAFTVSGAFLSMCCTHVCTNASRLPRNLLRPIAETLQPRNISKGLERDGCK